MIWNSSHSGAKLIPDEADNILEGVNEAIAA